MRAYPARIHAGSVAVVRDLVSIQEALDVVLSRAVALGPESVPLTEAHGRVLAEPALAAVDLPPFRSSAMDGYAVRAADAPGPLEVVGASAAGRPAERSLGAGEAIAVATGGVHETGKIRFHELAKSGT